MESTLKAFEQQAPSTFGECSSVGARPSSVAPFEKLNPAELAIKKEQFVFRKSLPQFRPGCINLGVQYPQEGSQL
jgi:hypothetical protein